MSKSRKPLSVLFLAVVLCLAVSLSAAATSITLGYVEWDCAISQTHIVAAALEERFGLDVELVSVEAGIMWAGLSQGDLDAIVAAWLPVTHGFYWEEYGDNLVDAGANFQGARIGLVVPAYVDIDSITDLNAAMQQFNGMIYGIDPGAGLMAATDEALDTYGLSYSVLDSSDAAMTIQLGQAVEANEWIVVTGWVPHWKFDSWDLKFLDDPEGVYGGAENVHTILREGFVQDFAPEITSFLEGFFLTQDQLHEMMNLIREEGGDELALARDWVAANSDVVDSWLQ